MSIKKETKSELIKKYSRNEGDTGSPEVQISILTERIVNLTDHFKTHKKDNHSRMGLLKLVSQRRKQLDYLKSKNEDKYKEIIKDNNIVFLVGHTSTQNDFADLKLIVDEVVPINHAKKVLKLNEVNIRLPKNSSKDLMNDIVDLANKNKGDHLFVVHIPSEDGQERKIISKKIKVSNNNQFLILLRDLLGDSNVWID